MAEEGEDRFDGLLLRLAGEHTEGGITEVSSSGWLRRYHVTVSRAYRSCWILSLAS